MRKVVANSKKKIKKLFAPLPVDEGETREMWPSRAAFLLAAIGSSVGLGNVWRFPALAFKWGGAAFFVPYLMALFIIGIPILALELSLGQVYRSGDVIAFSRISRRLRGLGLSSVMGAFIVNTYYTILMSWITIYFFRSFSSVLPWTVKDPVKYFNEDVVHAAARPSEFPETIVGATFGTQILTWLVIYFCLWKGVQLTGKIAYVTVTLPVVFIVILFFRGVTLPGAASGIADYIWRFDSGKLADPLIWSEAVGQIFFSIGIAFGTMTAYSSYNLKYQNTAVDSMIIGLSNSIYEIFCGFVVFSVVGYLRNKSGKDDVAVGGFGLAFATYPIAFSTLPAGQFWCVFFFLTLYILGIDSAFSLVEGLITVIKDSRKFNKYSRELIVAVVCVAGFLIGVVYCTDSGMSALDAVDYFLNNIAIVFAGMMECIGAGYFYRYNEVSQKVGAPALWTFAVSQIMALFVGVAIASISPLAGVLTAIGIMLIGAGVAIGIGRQDSLKERCYWLFLGQIEMLREDINSNFAHSKKSKLPLLWSICIKFLAPPILFVIFCIPFQAMATNSPGIPITFRWLGITISFLAVATVFIGLAAPQLFQWLMPEGFVDEIDSGDAIELKDDGDDLNMTEITPAQDRDNLEKEVNSDPDIIEQFDDEETEELQYSERIEDSV